SAMMDANKLKSPRSQARRDLWLRLSLALALALCCLLAACSRPTHANSVSDFSTPAATTPAGSSTAATKTASDSDGDGFPDSARLGAFDDKESFRRWFTAIAEKQFYQINNEWNPNQRDCAGLVRFAFRQALARHDYAWLKKMGADYSGISPDVRAYTLETGPLGEKLFRTAYGTFKPADVADGKFSDFADAHSLKNYNCTYIGKDRALAKPGDLIFFYQPWVQNEPYHAMIFVGADQIAGDPGRDWVVYHTGSSPAGEGTVKKVRLSVLDHHPDKRWRPVADNPNYQGFYRLKILE
ncbi:MAG TPA: DUF1175 family protein, partial [Blastocatellia bacterium]|nr:DUF1175 family protein [Blastocatellia bacterium]